MGHNLNPSQYQKKSGSHWEENKPSAHSANIWITPVFELRKDNKTQTLIFTLQLEGAFLLWTSGALFVVQVLSSKIYYSFQQRGETWLTDETASHSTRSHFSQLYYKINIIFSPYVVQLLSEERKEDSLNLGLGISVHSSVFRYILWFS